MKGSKGKDSIELEIYVQLEDLTKNYVRYETILMRNQFSNEQVASINQQLQDVSEYLHAEGLGEVAPAVEITSDDRRVFIHDSASLEVKLALFSQKKAV